MTLKEIKAIIYPQEKVDMKNVLKELLKLKCKEGELVTFPHIYLYGIGDPDLYVTGVSLFKDNIIVVAEMVYGGDVDAIFIGNIADKFSRTEGIRLTDNAIKKICKEIIETKKLTVDFDFNTMKERGCCYICGDSLEEKLQNDEKAINIIQGKEKGYFEY